MKMPHSKQTITLSISPEMVSRLHHFASEQHARVEDVAADLLSQVLSIRKHEVVRVVQSERKGLTLSPESDTLREIIQRQDEEIRWLRDQIARLSTLTPTTHVIRHEYPAMLSEQESQVRKPVIELSSKIPGSVVKETGNSGDKGSQDAMDDVTYTLPETGIDPEDLISSGFSDPGRVGGRTLRDSIGGVREEKEYSVQEAAAIAGENESVLLEYIADGVLPATQDGDLYRIRGNDLRRYMMSK
jgi:excisionase family DNA binding protein